MCARHCAPEDQREDWGGNRAKGSIDLTEERIAGFLPIVLVVKGVPPLTKSLVLPFRDWNTSLEEEEVPLHCTAQHTSLSSSTC